MTDDRNNNIEEKISIIQEGWLEKKGKSHGYWKKRFFVLYSDKTFEYYETEQKLSMKGNGHFKDISKTDVEGPELNVYTPGRVWGFKFASEVLRNLWQIYIHPLENIQGTYRKNGEKHIPLLREGRLGTIAPVSNPALAAGAPPTPTLEDESSFYKINTTPKPNSLLMKKRTQKERAGEPGIFVEKKTEINKPMVKLRSALSENRPLLCSPRKAKPPPGPESPRKTKPFAAPPPPKKLVRSIITTLQI